MLIRNENEIEIWNDTMKKGTGKNCIMIALIGMIIFILLTIGTGYDFTIIETYYFLGMLFFPCFIILICGFIFIKRENTKKLIAKINSNYVELYRKKNRKKQINIKQITKINKVSSLLGNFIVIFYKDNEKECKYSFEISIANKNLLMIAIQEYNNTIITN